MQLLPFDDWLPLAKDIDERSSDDALQLDFNEGDADDNGELNLEEFNITMKKIKDRVKELNDKLEDPEFREFFEAGQGNKMDEELSFEDWLPLAKGIDSESTDEELKSHFEFEDKDKSGSLDFKEYKVSIENLKKKVELRNKLKDPEFRKFYEADKTGPKDEQLTFEDWVPLANVLDPKA